MCAQEKRKKEREGEREREREKKINGLDRVGKKKCNPKSFGYFSMGKI